MPDAPRCWSGGYDVSGQRIGDPCPECGKRIIDDRDVLDHGGLSGRRSRFVAAVVVLGAAAFFVLTCSGVLYLRDLF